MRLLLCMPGQPKYQDPFWRSAIVDEGLETSTDLCFQANAKWNRDYPEDLLAEMTPGQIATEQYEHTRVRLDDDFMPKAYTHCQLDYEPHKNELRGPESSWLWSKLVDGTTTDDIEVLSQMRRAVQEATDGLPLGMYRYTTLPKREFVQETDTRLITSAQPFASTLDWIWMHCYPQGELDRENISDWQHQLATHFGALSKYGRRVVPFLWPSYRLSTEGTLNYAAPTLETLRRIPGVDTIGIWVDLNVQGPATQQTRNVKALGSHLRRVIGD